MFANPSHQPKIPTHTQHTSPSPNRQHIKTPLKTNANLSSQGSRMNAFAFTATCLVILKETVPKFPIVQNAEQKDTHRTDAPTSHRGPDTRAKLVNPETNRKGMKISHNFQAITISVCSVQEIIRPQIVHDTMMNLNH